MTPRQALDDLIRERDETYAAVSRLLGRNSAYIQQYIKRGTPACRTATKSSSKGCALTMPFTTGSMLSGDHQRRSSDGSLWTQPKIAFLS